ncbi:MAG: hypothetical protein GYA23_08320 [Methanomicrobiales archaeon]|nr:hypothetical protein [Methanomicrobiales archaeon]
MQTSIHIITAGNDIAPAYARTLRERPDITRTYIFADTELYTNSTRDTPEMRAQKESARHAVNRVKDHAASLGIPASLVYVIPPADCSARDAVLKINQEYPSATFSFNLSAGPKDMALALFLVSLWIHGETTYAYEGTGGVRERKILPVPKISAETISANPNYMKILATLARTPGKPEEQPDSRLLPRSYLFTQLAGFYIPVRKKGVKVAENRTGKTDLFTGKHAVLHELSQGTLSSILNTLVGGDLIREITSPDGNRKEKFYTITAAGRLALLLAELQPRKT